MTASKPKMMWEIDTKVGWLIRPDFVNKAIDENLIEIVNDKWIVHAMNKTTIAKDGDYLIYYDEGIEIYSKEFMDSVYRIFSIIKE